MAIKSAALFLYTESSLHAGVGASLSHIDLPIQREVHTGHPIIYPSGIKGGLRDFAQEEPTSGNPRLTQEQRTALFGPELQQADHGGLGIFKEGRVLLFPVRSLRGVFAWVTCPIVLSRFSRDLQAAFAANLSKVNPLIQELITQAKSTWSALKSGEKAAFCTDHDLGINNVVVLEDYDYVSASDTHGARVDELAKWFVGNAIPLGTEYEWWRSALKKRLVLLSDDDFAFFVRHHTEIQTHVTINDKTGTAAASGPWNEESLPPDTLLYSVVSIPTPQDKTISEVFADETLACAALTSKLVGPFQICGDRSLGKGIVRPRWFE